jgi:hypothetical protein
MIEILSYSLLNVVIELVIKEALEIYESLGLNFNN